MRLEWPPVPKFHFIEVSTRDFWPNFRLIFKNFLKFCIKPPWTRIWPLIEKCLHNRGVTKVLKFFYDKFYTQKSNWIWPFWFIPCFQSEKFLTFSNSCKTPQSILTREAPLKSRSFEAIFAENDQKVQFWTKSYGFYQDFLFSLCKVCPINFDPDANTFAPVKSCLPDP